MIQDKVTGFVINQLVNPAGEVEELKLSNLSHKYVVFVIFHAAFNDISSAELLEFSAAYKKFSALNAEVIGVSRDSTFAIRDWFVHVSGSDNERVK